MSEDNFSLSQFKYVDDKYEILHANYKIIKKIGEGTYGCVYEVLSKLDNKKYAMKRIDTSKRRNKESLLEPKNLVFIDDLMITNYKEKFYYHSWSENNCIFIKMRLMKGNITNLYNVLQFQNEATFRDTFMQIAKFLYLLHKKDYVHLDIKPGKLIS